MYFVVGQAILIFTLTAQVAAMGRLALIADTLGEKVIATGIRSRMKSVLSPWMTGQNPDKLQYDPHWGGICSSASLADGGADFGNGHYNECAPL